MAYGLAYGAPCGGSGRYARPAVPLPTRRTRATTRPAAAGRSTAYDFTETVPSNRRWFFLLGVKCNCGPRCSHVGVPCGRFQGRHEVLGSFLAKDAWPIDWTRRERPQRFRSVTVLVSPQPAAENSNWRDGSAAATCVGVGSRMQARTKPQTLFASHRV
eukprot:7378297-Prymnesium_polylepis.1